MADMPAGTTFTTVLGSLSGFTSDGADVNDQPDRVPLSGTVIAEPLIPSPGYVVASDDGGLIFGEPITERLDVNGAFSLKLVASDSPNLTPSGWMYRLTIRPSAGAPMVFKFFAKGGETYNLSDLLVGSSAFPTPDASFVQVGQGPPTASTPGNFYLDASTDDVWINA